MGIRITVMLDKSSVEKLRGIQAKLLRGSTKSVSFSFVLNRVVEEGIKRYKP